MSLNTIAAVQGYVDKIVGDGKIGGMKVLLLDSSTKQVVSMVYSQTQILDKEVYLVEQLDAQHEPMHHLKAAVFVRPTASNVAVLKREIAAPKFAEYHVFFSNIISPELLTSLAEADEHEVVRQVQECPADYGAINEDFFSLNMRGFMGCSVGGGGVGDRAGREAMVRRATEGVLSLLLSLKRKPKTIRYSASSPLAKQVASDVSNTIAADDIFDFRRNEGGGPLLLVLDRKDDPVTPLLSQWTYQAMVHELLGLNDNRVLLKGAPGIGKDLEEVVLSCAQDDFFAKHRHANFGDLGTAVKALMDEYQKLTKQNENIRSIEDMQSFLDRYPAFRSQSYNVGKHVAVLSELARLVEVYSLLDVSQLEQELACTEDHTAHFRELLDKIANPRIKEPDKVRLSMLYALRYQDTGNLGTVKSRLSNAGVSAQQVSQIDALLEYAGSAQRAAGLFGNTTLMSKMAKTLTTSLQGVQNVYAQHVPLLLKTVEDGLKGKLKDTNFPTAGGGRGGGGGGGGGKAQEVVVFVVGGVTYEEATKIAALNASTAISGQVVLGGTTVHNSTSFLEELRGAYGQ